MKVLVLLSRVPYPLEKGDKLRAFNQIKRLSVKHDIVLCCLSDKKVHPDAVKELEPYCIELKIIRLSKLRLFINLLRAFFSDKPLQVSYFYTARAQKIIDELVEKHLPKHIYCQLIRVTDYVRKYTIIRKTMDYMDALSTGVDRRIDSAPLYLKPVFKMEAHRLHQYEAEIFNEFEHKTIISEQDRALIEHQERQDIEVIPNGVDTSFFNPIERPKDYDIVFTGNMSYPPNVDGAQYIVKQIMPKVWKRKPQIKVLLSGAKPASAVKALADDRVKVTGWVDDIRESYARSRIFIAPMQIGTGLQNKLLEAMAMRLPCITSPLANNALGAIHQQHILVGETPEEYAEFILHLLEDEHLYRSIAENGYTYVRDNYDWNGTTERLERVMLSGYANP